MTATAEFSAFEAAYTTSGRRYDIPKLELRRRSDEHPMMMFGVIVATAFISMFLLAGPRPAQAAVNPVAMERSGEPASTRKTSRLPVSETDRVCQGQAWGAESLECLLMIAKEAGEPRTIRLVAADRVNSQTPNIF